MPREFERCTPAPHIRRDRISRLQSPRRTSAAGVIERLIPFHPAGDRGIPVMVHYTPREFSNGPAGLVGRSGLSSGQSWFSNESVIVGRTSLLFSIVNI